MLTKCLHHGLQTILRSAKIHIAHIAHSAQLFQQYIALAYSVLICYIFRVQKYYEVGPSAFKHVENNLSSSKPRSPTIMIGTFAVAVITSIWNRLL